MNAASEVSKTILKDLCIILTIGTFHEQNYILHTLSFVNLAVAIINIFQQLNLPRRSCKFILNLVLVTCKVLQIRAISKCTLVRIMQDQPRNSFLMSSWMELLTRMGEHCALTGFYC